jgi:hypothetical protein
MTNKNRSSKPAPTLPVPEVLATVKSLQERGLLRPEIRDEVVAAALAKLRPVDEQPPTR